MEMSCASVFKMSDNSSDMEYFHKNLYEALNMSNKTNDKIVTPLGKRILIAEAKQKSETTSGIILAGSGDDNSKAAIVLAVGPEVTEVEIGDTIYIVWAKASPVKFGDIQRAIISEEDILSVIKR